MCQIASLTLWEHLEPVTPFATPEASWKLAGGEASNASENHRIIAKKASTPAGVPEWMEIKTGHESTLFLAPPAGAHSFLPSDPVVLAPFGHFTTG
jgi:hypothetical protein